MSSANTIVIAVQDLAKSYGKVVAVDGISFEVHEGEIFGMVGPNGAGKTTTIECIEGLRNPDQGGIRVLGMEPKHSKYRLQKRIGVQLQESALPDRIKVWEAMDLFASIYSLSADWHPLLEKLGLAEKIKATYSKLSGGQKQRLFIALALINDPEVVFLDELTTGLDPHARRAIWDLVLGIRDQGKTVVLTTHFMEEAERLCNRVAIVDQGRIVALDTPENLIRSLGPEFRVTFRVTGPFEQNAFKKIQGVSRIEQKDDRVTIHGKGDRLLSGVVNTLEKGGVGFRDLRTEHPTLEDVFLILTGKKIRD
ncbi:MAG TPA: ABC transporter ATP-binding protein [Bacteroides sp.]|nr:ABC transporter ATP-binding protein [Bacteroides sp.]